jgi:hypothetical protein|tara:strand:+ start:132 stop:680 length:549 start_codon:yes stop_codon:yes gene_type:complete
MARPSNSLIRSQWVKELFRLYNRPSNYGNIINAWEYIKTETTSYYNQLNQLVEENRNLLYNSQRRRGDYLCNYLADLKDIILSLKARPDINENQIKERIMADLISDNEIKALLILKGKYTEPPPAPTEEECSICMINVPLQNNRWVECGRCNNKICQNCKDSLMQNKCTICRAFNTYATKTF